MPSSKFKEKKLIRLLEQDRFEEIRKKYSKIDPADLADILEDLDNEDVEKIFSILDNDYASDVIVEMEPNEVEDVIEMLPPKKLAEMMNEMAPDDAADFFNELKEDEKEEVSKYLTEEQQHQLNELLDYEEDSAGGLMTSEFCALVSNKTVQEAINLIAATDFSDPVSTIFVVDNDNHLIGSINISELLAKSRNEKLENVIERDPVCSTVDQDQEEVAQKFLKYDLYAMPVVDENNRLVGRITVDDVMDVIHDEANEDMAHMAGAPDIERNELSPFRIVKLRLPWLMITMCTGMIVSIIIQKMTGVTNIEALAAFVPVIMAMGGNTGMQSSAVTIRSIALGEIEFNQLISVFGRELTVGIIMGLSCGIFAMFVVWANISFFHASLTQPPIKLAVIVSCSMCIAMAFAAFTGTMMPIILHRFDIDPAVASGPFVTTGNDLSATLIYFLICYVLLKM
jgi:magnesium transporter